MAIKRVQKVYADTSVFGGVFDEEFEKASREFFDLVRWGRFSLVVSNTLAKEISDAPSQVQELFAEMDALSELAVDFEAAVSLQQSYITHGIVRRESLTDALHVALATVSGCQIIVSWNFRDIVHFQKIPLYNAVNRLEGYSEIAIHSPQEVIADEDQDV